MNDTVFLVRDDYSFEELEAFAAAQGWRLGIAEDGDGRVLGFTRAWAARGDSRVDYVHEPAMGVRFLVLSGPHAGDLAADLGGQHALRTVYDVLRVARHARTEEQRARCAFELAAAFLDAPDDEALGYLRAWYRTGSESLRRRVTAALVYRAWPEGIAFLDEIAAGDVSPALRADAARCAEVARARRADEGRPVPPARR